MLTLAAKILRGLLVAVMLLPALAAPATAQGGAGSQREFEEIVVSFEIPKLLREDIFVQFDGQTVYLPLIRVFSLLDINITADLGKQNFSGFFIDEDRKYELDLMKYRIKVFGEDHPYLASDYYVTDNELYVRVETLARLFDLRLTFDFSLLRVYLPLDKSFPAYQKIKRRAARTKLKERIVAARDVVSVRHSRDLVSGGTVDWSISTNPVGGRNKHYYSLVTGGILLGGDFTIATGGSNEEPFNQDQFDYRWHYYVSDNSYLTQAELGTVHSGGSLGRSLTGAMITNRPQERRKYFQTLNLHDYVGEGWEVELWVDNKLTDFMVTGADGFYEFNTDVFYGACNIELRMFGPNGELRTDEKVIRVPYNLIPRDDFEYAVSGGTTTINHIRRNYIQANSYYGVLTGLTVGASLDCPVAAEDGEKPVIAADINGQLMGNLILNGSIARNYAAKAGLNYSKPSLVNINVDYTRFYENTIRNPLGQLSKISLSVSSPFKIGSRYFGLRYNISSDKYPTNTSMHMNYGFQASVNPFHLTYLGKYKKSTFATRTTNNMTSQVLLSARIFRFLRPQVRFDYDHSHGEIAKYGIYLAHRLFRTGQLTVSVEHNVASGNNTIMATFNLFTGFADFTSRFVKTSQKASLNQLQRGSVRYNRETRSVQFDRRNGVGTGSAVVRPFHDANYNGVMDTDEEYIAGLRARIDGGRMSLRGRERQYYYDGLRPYEDYLVRIDQYSLDNPLYKPTHEHYQVKVNPNVVTAIKVPIVTTSEISGRVERQVGNALRGQGGVKLILLNLSKETVVELTTFSSGEYYYLGLIPGSYKAYLDPDQLKHYGYVAKPKFIEFEIQPVEGGISLENINFELVPELSGSSPGTP